MIERWGRGVGGYPPAGGRQAAKGGGGYAPQGGGAAVTTRSIHSEKGVQMSASNRRFFAFFGVFGCFCALDGGEICSKRLPLPQIKMDWFTLVCAT